MRIGEKSIETAITVLGAFKVAIKRTGQINVRKENEEETIEYIDMAIDALESQDKIDKWIPCSEQLPKDSKSVLIYAKDITISGRQEIIRVGAYNNGFWFIQNTVETLGFPKHEYEVIAWQPLPEPYNPKE